VRLKVTREIRCAWETPVRAVIAALRVMPLDHDGQAVVSWRIEPSIDGRLRSSADAFGNMLHHLQADGPFEALTIRVDGLVDLSDQAGVVRGAREAAPPMLFLRDSVLTAPDDGVRSFAARSVAVAATPLDRAHALAGAAAELGASEAARSPDGAREVMACPPGSCWGSRTAPTSMPASPARIPGPSFMWKGWAGSPSTLFCGCARRIGMFVWPSASTLRTPAPSGWRRPARLARRFLFKTRSRRSNSPIPGG
jgi:hypothetical protein